MTKNKIAVFFGILLLFGIKTKGFGHLVDLFDEKFTLLSMEMLLACFAAIFVVMFVVMVITHTGRKYAEKKHFHSLLSSVVFGLFMLCTFWLFQYSDGMDDLKGQPEEIMMYVVFLGPLIFLGIVDGFICRFDEIDLEDAHIFAHIGVCLGIAFVYFIIIMSFLDHENEIFYNSYCYYLIALWVASQVFIYLEELGDVFTASSSSGIGYGLPLPSSGSSSYSSSSSESYTGQSTAFDPDEYVNSHDFSRSFSLGMPSDKDREAINNDASLTEDEKEAVISALNRKTYMYW